MRKRKEEAALKRAQELKNHLWNS